jgi:hypothetical protein
MVDEMFPNLRLRVLLLIENWCLPVEEYNSEYWPERSIGFL